MNTLLILIALYTLAMFAYSGLVRNNSYASWTYGALCIFAIAVNSIGAG